MSHGRFYGVGVGPGDPELLTLKAFRLIQQADVVSYITNAEGISQAKTIASLAFESVSPKQSYLPFAMPMSTDRQQANTAYDLAAESIRKYLAAGKNVVFLCEGDPLFFGSFTYLLDRLNERFSCEIVPGISSVHAAAATLQLPLTLQKESFAVISGRHSDEQIKNTLMQHDSVVIMKAGQARERILALLQQTGRTAHARYLEYIGRDNQTVIDDVRQLSETVGPYFSLFVVLKKRNER